ncbi:class I SAM-dependent methyltransferase [Flavobacterium sp. SUN052]|uniref:class I SAM-dependent methyltransferase n=1 Tax=Flavobacterium sp. SUN052 TaxID=3002441 RepID=UPI00237D9DFD|nr:class I SAM-dependent methyltransferase [Flavobacterium sp. SUN052]MEC4004395.1 class I SAM-dependent methyltransferase [Flavobacterium sp. SUN052]
MSLESLKPLIKKTGSKLSVEEFQSVVNVVFHDYEAEHYDVMHVDMKKSLQEQIDLLIGDLLKDETFKSNNKSLLDVGCGTGMSTELLLNSKIGSTLHKISLLDTSPKMLQFAEEKAKKWNVNYELINADISNLDTKYDIIIICSVLHHIPNLEVFLNKIKMLLNTNGILIHLQDPNGDYLTNNDYRKRLDIYEKETTDAHKSFNIRDLIPKKIKHYISRKLGRKTYIDLVNDKLLELNAINKRMTADEIWSITDIHVETKDIIENKGISFNFLKKQLSDFSIVSQRSYGFYGLLKSDLSEEFQEKESELINKNDLTGRNIACLWKKNNLSI